MSNFKLTDYDIIYLSYDEPNAEKNYADLCKKIPWAKRVHGVKGSDAAHKACAKLSETKRFTTVDGDNIVNENFLNQRFDLGSHEDIHWNKEFNIDNCVISFGAQNTINGLIYGNGGIKCWPKDKVLNMRTHENADPGNPHAQVDFCWDLEYIQVNRAMSIVYNNSSPKQAWRAGFREGVKMALDRGVRPSLDDFKNNHWQNLHRLYVWLMVGSDVENGMYAILGAREGLYKTMCTDWNYINVRDFDYLNDYWDKTKHADLSSIEVSERVEELGVSLRNHLQLPIAIDPLDSEQSKFFKTVYQNPMRTFNKFLIR